MLRHLAKKWYILLVFSLIASVVAVPAQAGIEGEGVSGVQVQNLQDSPGSVSVSLYPQGGGNPIELDPVNVGALAAANFYLPSLSSVTAGVYSMVVSSANQVGAIARTDWSSTGGGGIYGSVPPGNVVIIPLVLSGFANQVSQVAVQNTNTDAAVTDVSITLYGRGLSDPVREITNQTIAAGASRIWELDDAGVFGALPNTGTDLGSNGFVGSMVIESTSTPLVAATFIDIAGTPGVTAYSGVSGDAASQNLYCPLVRANYFGDTGIQIVNDNDTAATVTITFRADPQSPNPGQFTQSISVPANSSAIAFQGPGGNSRQAPTNLPGGTQTNTSGLTNNGFFGSALLESNVTILAAVNDSEFGPNFAVRGQSTYNCVPASSAGTTHFLPLLRRFHLSNTRLTTGVQVLNVTGGSGQVSLDLVNFDQTDAPDPAAKTLGANGAANFYGGDWQNLPTVPADLGGFGWFGSGVITCAVDCIVLVSDENGPGASTRVDRANYTGIVQVTE